MNPGNGRFLSRMFRAIAVLALSTIPAQASRAPSPPLDPKTYESPSKQYALLVNPSDPNGLGKAGYRFSQNGKTLWEGERPYTLLDVSVLDDGTIAGHAYSNGPDGWNRKTRDEYGELILVILDASGKARLEKQTKRGFGPRVQLEQSPHPVVTSDFVDSANDRIIFRMHDNRSGSNEELWQIYRLSDGSPIASYRPTENMPDCEEKGIRATRVIHAIPGTRLFLTQWSQQNHDMQNFQIGLRYCVLEETGKIVWTLDRPTDLTMPGGWPEASKYEARHAPLASPASPRRFHIRIPPERVSVEFEVAEKDSAWTVTEIGRTPYVPADEKPKEEKIEVKTTSAWDLIPEREPPYLCDMAFQALPDGQAILLEDACLGPDGTFYVLDRRTMQVFVFTPDGALEFVCRPDPSVFSGKFYPESEPLFVAGKGEIYVKWKDASLRKVNALHFSALGQWLGLISPLPQHLELAQRVQPGTQRMWGKDYKAIYLLDEKGEKIRMVNRGADGTWLQSVGIDMAPDGSIAVVDSTPPSFYQRDAKVHLFDREGEPIRSFAIPAAPEAFVDNHPVYDGKHVLTRVFPNTWVLWDVSGKALLKFDPKNRIKPDSSYQMFLSPDGKSLLALDSDGLRLHRWDLSGVGL